MIPGKPVLSPALLADLRLAADGQTIVEAARARFVSPETVKSNRRKLLLRLHARNTTHAVHLAHEQGLL